MNFIASLSILLLTLFVTQSVQAQSSNQNSPPAFMKFSQSQLFSLPVKCTIGEDCHILNYVDYNPDDDVQTDTHCHHRTYDGHKGTDFALLSGKAMEDGVDVVAAMDGVVAKTRDGEPDLWADQEKLDEIKANRKECGNAVMIDHDNGLRSIYCHMKQGSITVKPDQAVKVGQKIGEVGLSGFTQFPHLHFGVLHNKKVIDPFTGQHNLDERACGKVKKSFWKKNINLEYQPFTIQSVGFSNQIPDLKRLEKNNKSLDKIKLDSNILSFWMIAYGLQKGDEVVLEINDPNGKIFATNKIIQDKKRARQFYYIGKKITNKTKLSEGAYTGSVRITRDGKAGKEISQDKFIAVLIAE